MVTNAPAEFYEAKKKFEEAKTDEEKLKALEEMLKYAPKHKGAENLLAWIKKEISKYKKSIKKSKKSGLKIIEKNGDILISVISLSNNLIYEFFKKISNINENIGFNTIINRTIFYNGVYYQFVNIPSFDPIYRSIISQSNYLIILLDNSFDINTQIESINEFLNGILEISISNKGNKYEIINDINNININEILEKIIKDLGYIRVFPINSKHCVLLKKENNKVKDFIEEINSDWINKFIYAKIIRNNKNIRAGLNYELNDFDIVELKLKL